MNKIIKFLFLICVLSAISCTPPQTEGLPKRFVYLSDVIPDITIDLRYYTDNNFIGTPIDGYLAPKCIITKDAAIAIKKVQDELKTYGLCLKIFDTYRPQQAVDHFVRWANDYADTLRKAEYYPNVKKNELIPDYIASKSGHSRGSTVDLTIIPLNSNNNEQIDMGGTFDYFGKVSWVNNLEISPNQRTHRMLLQTLMIKHGFKSYSKEWWHFTLQDEPFPNTYFNFPVK